MTPLAGFWLGGYEGADHVNGAGQPLDLVAASGHLARLDEDHRRARQAGLAAVRESIGWRLSEDGSGRIDLSRALAVAASARRHGLQVLWTLMHYGVPTGLSLHDDRLIERFARFAAEVARQIGLRCAEPPVFNLINEISYVAWLASQAGDLYPPNGQALHLPPLTEDEALRCGDAVKRRLVRAMLAGMAAVRAVDPRARFMHVDPVLHVVAPAGEPGLAEQAARVRSWQWQGWDLLSGRLEPELGGHPAALDLMGLNHYQASQWETGTEARLNWHARDRRRLPLAALLAEVWQRYRRPMLLAETSHVGLGRAGWLHDVADQLRSARAAGLPVLGVCLYPLTDRPDWLQGERWHRSGLWHVGVPPPHVPDARPEPTPPASAPASAPPPSAAWPRLADADYMQALRQWQRVLPGPAAGPPLRAVAPPLQRPPLLVFTHLRWGFVRHRVEQLVSRLAKQWAVVVVEEAHHGGDQPPRLDRVVHGPQLEVLVPCLPHLPLLPDMPHLPERPGRQGFDIELLPLLQRWWAERGWGRPLAFISTPMAWPLAQALQPCAVVLDCADELAGFLHPPPGLAALERAALAQADLVLAAGAALARPRAALAGTRLRVLRNGADPRLFRPRGPVPHSWECAEAALLRPTAPGPQVGHAGVIDERFDLALLAALADARPGWQFVIVGPVVKIDPGRLPRRPNLHWLGEQPYRVLPGLMAAWRMALLPFLDTLATRHASPLKLLEALAAGLPVVATQLPGIDDLCDRAGAAGARVRRVPAVGALVGRVDDGDNVDAVPDGRAIGAWLAACDAAIADHRPALPLPPALHWDRLAAQADRLLCAAAGLPLPPAGSGTRVKATTAAPLAPPAPG